MEFCDDEKLLKKLSDSAVLLDQVQKGLNDYLETKRGVFVRFYFLSNDDLLSILSESKDVMRARDSASRRVEAPSRNLHQSSLGEDIVAGFFFAEEAVRTASGRVKANAVAAMASMWL